MFTVDDIKEIAIQIEHNGEQAYRRAADLHRGRREIGELFEQMAKEERQHRDWFLSISSGRMLDDEHRRMEEMGRQLLREMVADQTFSLDEDVLSRADTLLQTLEQSRQFEEDTILFYEFLMGVIDDESARERLAAIIAEERRHVERIVALAQRIVVTERLPEQP